MLYVQEDDGRRTADGREGGFIDIFIVHHQDQVHVPMLQDRSSLTDHQHHHHQVYLFVSMVSLLQQHW
jgi:hypothetical protein